MKKRYYSANLTLDLERGAFDDFRFLPMILELIFFQNFTLNLEGLGTDKEILYSSSL